ncbi:uncharacterized protein LOC143274648 [Babylonia areolata]|uniref:uncharacterized protein LOC143274648 n=1 Tax=Babylonia areolata TaxID=304850 RepID=UPI003FD2927F
MEDDGFQIVRRSRGKRRSKQIVVAADLSTCPAACNKDAYVDTESLHRRIQQCCKELWESQFYAAVKKNLDEAVQAALCADTQAAQDTQSGCVSAEKSQYHSRGTGDTAMPESLKGTELGTDKEPDHVRACGSDMHNTEITDVSLCSANIQNERSLRGIVKCSKDANKKAADLCVVSRSVEDSSEQGVESLEAATHGTEDSPREAVGQFSATCCPQDKQSETIEVLGVRNKQTDVLVKDSDASTHKTEEEAEECCETSMNDIKKLEEKDLTRGPDNIRKNGEMKQHIADGGELLSTDHNTNESNQGRKETGEETVCMRDTCSGVGLVVYGLGNFASCLIARYQLALALALRQHLKVRPGCSETYDPKYTGVEKQILADLGFTVIDDNEEGKRQVQEATVVMMPHCGKALFNNLLWANWSPWRLPHLVVLGNSFSAMLDSIPSRLWNQHIGFIAKIQGHMVEEQVENSFTHTDVFNDLSIHWFPAQLLRQLPPSTWSQAEEPSYDVSDVEIVLRSQT